MLIRRALAPDAVWLANEAVVDDLEKETRRMVEFLGAAGAYGERQPSARADRSDVGGPLANGRCLRIPAEDRGDVKRPSGALATNIHEPVRQSGCTRDARSSLSRGTTLCGNRRARAGRSTRR